MKMFRNLTVSLLLLATCGLFNAKADHVAGTDITYSCTSTPGIYKISFSFFRTCTGISVCPNTCGAPCSRTLQVTGADPGCNGTSFGSVTVSLVGVRDMNINPRCPSAKSICNNMNCVSAGTYTPAIERYDFEGTVNLGTGSGIPSSCCNVRVSWTECCRSAEISTGSTWQNYYVDCVINRCAAANTPCNSGPVMNSDPFMVVCSGQPVLFSNGIVDPDLDSLTFAFAPSLTAANTSVTYNPPYAYNLPMPYYPPAVGPYPLGIQCEPTTGDIMFTPVYSGSGQFVGVVAIEIKQWRTLSGVPTVVGITRRDIQMWIVSCPPNNPARIMTNPSVGTNAKTTWEVCGGSTLCFDVIAKDTDFYPFNTPPLSDTTYLSWNSALASKGATFLPKYNIATRTTTGPREDIYQFCWTPTEAMASNLPYYFAVQSQDSRCPNSGRGARTIAITVKPLASVTLNKTNYKCGKWAVSYTKNIPSQTFSSTLWEISKVPYDFSLTNVNTYINTVTTPVQYLGAGGKYLVRLTVNTPGASGGPTCSKSFYDTLFVDSVLLPIVRDTLVCSGSSVTMSFSATGGTPPYSFRWFYPPDTFFTPLNAPFFSPTTWSIPTPATSTTRYTLQVRDINGCRGYDSNVFVTVGKPVFTSPKTATLCQPGNYTIDRGNNNRNVQSYLWSTGDTVRTITRDTTTIAILTITDTSGCSAKDTFTLYVNAQMVANAGNDTVVCGQKNITLRGGGGQLYQWKVVPSGTIVSAKSASANVLVAPSTTTSYELTVYTTLGGVECSAKDTVKVTVNHVPVSTLPATWRMCPGSSYTLDAGNNGGKPVSYLWNTGDTSRTITRSDSNTFIVVLTESGCTVSDSLKLYVNKPVIAFAGSDSFSCGTKPFVLKATGGQLYQWRNINTNQVISAKSATANVNVTPATPTSYELTAYVTQSSLECSGKDSVSLNVYQPPVSTLPPTARICAGTAYTLDAGNNGGKPVNYLWSTSQISQTITQANAGLYVVVLTDPMGCRVADSLVLYVNDPVAANAGNDIHICAAQTVTLHASGGQQYSWKNMGTNTVLTTKSTNPDAIVPVSALTYFEATVFATQGGVECWATDSMGVYINPKLPVPVIAGPDTVPAAKPAAFTVGATTGNSYNWTVGNGTLGSGNGTAAVSVAFTNVGTGLVKVVESNSLNCKSDTAQKTVVVTPATGLKTEAAKDHLHVYPNPTTGMVTVEMETAAGNVGIEVRDILGRSVLKTTTLHTGGSFRKTIDLSALNHGVYFVQVSNGLSNLTVKVTLK